MGAMWRATGKNGERGHCIRDNCMRKESVFNIRGKLNEIFSVSNNTKRKKQSKTNAEVSKHTE